MIGFEVHDTGIGLFSLCLSVFLPLLPSGIPDSSLPKLFQAYTQAKVSITREHGGLWP